MENRRRAVPGFGTGDVPNGGLGDPDAPLPFGDFELIRQLGEGGMGTVFEAVQRSLQKRVAVKVLARFGSFHPQAVTRFLEEARAVAQLRHPNIVDVHGLGRTPDGGYFLVMDLVDGSDLARRAAAGALEPREAARIVAAIAGAVQHAHEKGIIHRDLKPSNVIVDSSGTPILTDFGLSKQIHREIGRLSRPGDILGTPVYMAPEQADPKRGAVGPSTDVYGLGGILYTALTGSPPCPCESFCEVLAWLLGDEPPVAPSDLRFGIPPALEAVCLRCLAKDPSSRYPTAAAVAADIQAWLGHGHGHAEARPDESPSPSPSTCELPTRLPRVSSAAAPSGLAARGGSPGALRRGEPRTAPAFWLRILPRNVRAGDSLVARVGIEGLAPETRIRVRLGASPETRVARVGADLAREGPAGRWDAGSLAFRLVALEPGPLRLEVVVESEGQRGSAADEVEVHPNASLPFVGRESSSSRILKWLDAEGCGICLLRGEAGIGKTRLSREVAIRFARRGATVVSGKCRSSFRSPLQPFREVCLDLLDQVEADASRRELADLVAGSLRHLLPGEAYVADYFRAFVSGEPMSRGQKSMGSYYWLQLFRSVAAGRPVLAVLDDLQWSDAEAIQLLAELLGIAQQKSFGLKVLAIAQPFGPSREEKDKLGMLETKIQGLRADGIAAEVIDLPPLEQSELDALVDATFPGNGFRDELPWIYEALRRKTGGNPLFAEWVLKRLRADAPAPGRVHPGPRIPYLPLGLDRETFESFVPEEIESALELRLAGLSAEEREAVRMAAAIGDPFDVRILEPLLGGAVALDGAMQALEREELVAPADRPVFYRFVHSLIHHKVYRDFSEGSHWRATRLHGQIADSMAAIYTPRELDERSLSRAHHLILANRPDEGCRHLLKGAGRLLDLQLYAAAVTHLERARNLVAGGVLLEARERALLHFRLGETYLVLGRTDEALKHLDSAREEREGADVKLQASIDLARGSVHLRRGELERAVDLFRSVLTLDVPDGRSQIASAISGIAAVHRTRGQPRDALELQLRALELRRQAGVDAEVATSWVNVGNAYFDLGDLEHAERAYRTSVPIFRSQGLKNYLIYALSGLGNVLSRKDARQAVSLYEEAIRLCQESGNRAQLGVLHYNLSEIAFAEHRYGDSLREVELALGIMETAGRRSGEARARSVKAELHLLLGDPDAAEREIEKAEAAARVTENPLDLAAAKAQAGSVAIARSVPDRAREAADAALRLLGDRPEASVRVVLAQVLVDLGDLAAARAQVEAASRDPTFGSRADAEGALERLRGLCAESPEDRRRHLERALDVATDGLTELPNLLSELAGLSDGDRRSDLAARAANLLRRRAEGLADAPARRRYLLDNPKNRRIVAMGSGNGGAGESTGV